MRLCLGPREFDVTHRALVMGILNRTPDSFYDRGETWDFGAFLEKADRIVTEGADILDVGGVKAGPGPEVSEAEELDRIVPAVEALVARFDVPVSADTWRSAVLQAACEAGAVIGNDISGFADPRYLEVAGAPGHRSSPPTFACGHGCRIPSPSMAIWWARCASSSSTGRARPSAPASRPIGSCSTPGSTLGRRRRRAPCS